jgi:hypothetical protein
MAISTFTLGARDDAPPTPRRPWAMRVGIEASS